MIKQGQTSPDDWKPNSTGGRAIYVDVDTSAAQFPVKPHYLTSLEGNQHHWDCGGINAVYNATKNGFRIYIKWVDKKPTPLTPSEAKANGWYIKWTGIIADE